MNNLNELRDACYRIAQDKGWHDPGQERTFGEYIALMHSELSEALEEHRNGHRPNQIHYISGKAGTGKPEGIPIELADVIIRIMDYCGSENIDIHKAVALKMEYNSTRPHRHGGKKI